MNKTFPAPGDRCGWPQGILFDLDGTLIDSVPDIAVSTNILLEKHNLAPHAVDMVRGMIGNGVKKLVERAFAAHGIDLAGDLLEARTDEMMTIYAGHLVVDTAEMPDAGAMLKAYGNAGVKLGIVTNKPESFTLEIVSHFGWKVDCIVGGDTVATRKPAPDMLYHACEQIGFKPARVLMVGDSPADIDAAKAASMASIAVRGGYTNIPADELGADIVIDRLGQLPQAIEQMKAPV